MCNNFRLHLLQHLPAAAGRKENPRKNVISICTTEFMIRFFLLAFMLLLLHTGAIAQTNPKYDKAMADSMKGDDYGMKMYVLAILKTGPANITDTARTNKLFEGHMANIGRLAKEGKLIVAGPMRKNDRNYRGIFILNVKTTEEAKTLTATDPAVAAGIFDVEFYNWYGSAALALYLPWHEKLQKNAE